MLSRNIVATHNPIPTSKSSDLNVLYPVQIQSQAIIKPKIESDKLYIEYLNIRSDTYGGTFLTAPSKINVNESINLTADCSRILIFEII